MWRNTDAADLILVTTNAMLNARGELVMGKGAAEDAKKRFPTLPLVLGEEIKRRGLNGAFYGVVTMPHPEDRRRRIGAFQVKYHWRQNADLELIQRSAEKLAATLEKHPGRFRHVAMNFPGIGNGRLKREEVLPLLACLPECVRIYELP